MKRYTLCWRAFAGANRRFERRRRDARTTIRPSVRPPARRTRLVDSFHSFVNLIFSFCLCIKPERIYHRVYHRVSLAYFFFAGAGSAAFLAFADAASASARALASALRFCFTERPFFFVPSRVYPDMDASVEEKAMPEPRPRPPEEAWDGIVMANALLAAMEAATQRRKNPNASVSRAPSTIVASRVGSRSSARRLALTRGERDERRAAIHRFSRRDDGGARLALRANRRGLRASVNHTSNSQSNQSINQIREISPISLPPSSLARDSLRSHLLRVLSVPNRNRNLARESHPYSPSIFDDRSRRPRRTREIRITDRVSIQPSASASNGAKPRVECHRSIDRSHRIDRRAKRREFSRVESSRSRVRPGSVACHRAMRTVRRMVV